MSGAPLHPDDITEAMVAADFPELTPCECRVLYWVFQGKTDPEIAAILDRATLTISTQVRNLLQKPGLENRCCAIREVVCRIICRTPKNHR